MNSRPSFDDLLSEWLEDGPVSAPAPILETVGAALPSIPQRRGLLRLRWRSATHSRLAQLAAAAILVVAVGALGFALLPGGLPGPAPTPSAEPSPSPSASPTASPSAQPALTETFSSNIHGISVGYPAGWSTTPATNRWTSNLIPHQDQSVGDVIAISESNSPFILLVSQPLSGRSGDIWIADFLASGGCTETEAVEIDGTPGTLGPDCFDGSVALVTTGGRGYLVFFYGDDPTFFNDVLATVQLSPEDALDATPSSST
jgi:hypothetical protein